MTDDFLKNIINQSLDIICTINRDGVFVWVNDAAQRILGFAPKEMMGKSYLHFLSSQDQEKTTHAASDIMKGIKTSNFTNRYISKDGREVLLAWSARWDENEELLYCVARDITEIQKAEEKVKRSEEVFKALVKEGAYLVSIVNPDATYKYVSPKHAQFLGIKEEQLLGKTSLEFIHPNDRRHVQAQFEKLYEINRIKTKPFRFKSSDGTWRWMQSVATNLIDDPAIGGVVINTMDITEIVLAQDELNESKEEYQNLFNTSPLPKWIYDLETLKILEVNKTAIRHYGYSYEEFLSMTIFDIRPKEEIPRVKKGLQSLKNKRGIIQFGVYTHKKKDGSLILMNMSGHRINYDGRKCIMIVGSDVTERENTLRALEASEARYRGFYESQTNYVIRTDMQGCYTYVNKKFLEDFAWIHGEKSIIGKNCMLSICEYDHEKVGKVVEKCISKPGKAIKVEIDKPHKKQGVVTTLWDFICITDAEGVPKEIQCMGVDISERINFEKQLKQSNERFELVMQASSDSIWDFNPRTKELFLGDGFRRNFGVQIDTVKNTNNHFNSLIHPSDRKEVLTAFKKLLEDKGKLQWEKVYRFKRADGSYAHIKDRAVVLREKNGKAYRVVGAMQDISTEYFYKKLESIENEVMQESMYLNTSLKTILNKYLSQLEILLPDLRATILKIQDNKIYNLMSPSMPKAYIETIEGSEIGPNVGSCGTAAFLKEKVIVEDIKKDPRWKDYKQLGDLYDFRACWSVPIFNTSGDVVATFANYYRTPKKPKKIEIQAIERSQKLISILFERFNYLESLKLSNERYDYVNKATNDAIYDWDVQNDKLYWGESFVRIFGHPITNMEFELSDWSVLIHPDEKQLVSDSLMQFVNNPKETKWLSEYKLLKTNGNYAQVEEIGYMIRDKSGKALRMIGVLRDVTERKIAEEEIKKSNERFEKVTQATQDAIWDWDILNNKLYWGEGYRTLFGYDFSNEPSYEIWKERIHPKDFSALNNEMERLLSDKNVSKFQSDYRFKRADGSYAYVVDKGVIIRDENGKAIRMLGAISDITTRKENEALLKRLNEALENRAKELSISNAELEQFAYVASHDLQEPLRMVTSFLAQLEKKYSHVLDEKAHTYIHFAVDGATRMRQIILDLLEFSRVGKHEDKKSTFSLTEIVEEIYALNRKIIEEKKAKVIYKNLPEINSFKTPVFQILQNLIGNSLKYAKENVPPIIKIKAKKYHDSYLISVNDNGIGIEEAYYEKIFVIFQRLHNRESYSGTGMGLAIVKKIVDNLGGKVWLESVYGEGSTFYIQLPK
jgi:PAS domain S-box-containing protein